MGRRVVATALVVSAAKQSGIRYNARTLNAALTDSARYIETLPANSQGSGLIQVAKAIDRLRELQSSQLIDITVHAPVVNKLSGEFATPGVGVGIYEREGCSVGLRQDRTNTLERTSGPAKPLTFALSWQGNDGTFSSPSSIVLPVNKPVELRVSIEARSLAAALTSEEHLTTLAGPVLRQARAVSEPRFPSGTIRRRTSLRRTGQERSGSP